ncbi:MAG: glutamine synthetase adenylyltransferase [Anaerolineae bacterium]|nr:glutamine synthetase adenylyltransferase [Anaerolineae bacterium]MDW8071707.1 glutamine synthetase adenylyltransferase [Anaerolineae bacterium]
MSSRTDEVLQQVFSTTGFANSGAAYHALERMLRMCQDRELASHALFHLSNALPLSADPDRALINLERFVAATTEQRVLWEALAASPRPMEMLTTLFAGSQFLTEILLRHPEYFWQLMELRYLARPKNREQMEHEIRSLLDTQSSSEAKWSVLRRYQRRELLRIGASDLCALLDLPSITGQLSCLADSLIRIGLELAAEQTGVSPDGFAVIGLGKLGGEELNYSSDIDLLFVASGDPFSYRQLGACLIDVLSRVTADGFLYRVDMRLRPWGRAGPLVSSLRGYEEYMQHHAQVWEKQALLKARFVAGDEKVGAAFLGQAEKILLELGSCDPCVDIHTMKQRIEAFLRSQNREWGEVKLGVGSIRDVEFVTQYLQLIHGPRHPHLYCANTLEALHRLALAELLSAEDYCTLGEGYTFLRTVEHYLQILEYHQTSTLPRDMKALHQLARRMGFTGEHANGQLLLRYEQHSTAIRRVYQRFLEGAHMTTSQSPCMLGSTDDVARHVARMDASYTSIFSPAEIACHAALAELLSDDNLVEIDAQPLDQGRWRVTIVAYDYPGELSLICGLLFVYGFSIVDGYVFTYESLSDERLTEEKNPSKQRLGGSKKIVDVFTVEPVRGGSEPELWRHYRDDLAALLRMMQAGERRKARGELAKRVAAVMRDADTTVPTLYPVDIEIDNESSSRYTVLTIETPDTPGFLYEFSNALALNRIYIARVVVSSVGNRVRDILYVTDEHGQKITLPERQRELRAATVLIKHFTHLLPRSPDPETALLHFREFLAQLFMRPDWPDELASLERHDVLDALARLLGVSEFLWDDFLRMQHANLFPVVRDVDALATARSREQLRAMLHRELEAAPDYAARREALNAFKDREMFRVDMRHILGHITEFGQFSSELSDLAEVVVEAGVQLCENELRARYGVPLCVNGQPAQLCVCALGKLGGRELGFASDIELMFIFKGSGQTSGPQSISTAEYYERLVQLFITTIRARREGTFHIDLQLRPYGKHGSMAVPLEAFRRYFAPDGEAWAYERQALVKLRPLFGDAALAQEILALRDAYVYHGGPFDVMAMRAMRERQIRHLVAGGTLNAKFSPGGLVDLEYLVQALQINHGAHNPALRETNTGRALNALAEAGILSMEQYMCLREALIFLRRLINALRVVRGNARDLTVPPADSEEFAFLARRLGYGNDLARLHRDLLHHTTNVQALMRQILG